MIEENKVYGPVFEINSITMTIMMHQIKTLVVFKSKHKG